MSDHSLCLTQSINSLPAAHEPHVERRFAEARHARVRIILLQLQQCVDARQQRVQRAVAHVRVPRVARRALDLDFYLQNPLLIAHHVRRRRLADDDELRVQVFY